MLRMLPFTGSASDWDDLVVRLENGNVFASHAWSTVQAMKGWRTLRFVGGEQARAFQLFTKKFGQFGTLGWVPGGIIGSSAQLDASLRESIQNSIQTPLSYLRIAFPFPLSYDVIADATWQRAKKHLGAAQSVVLDLSRSLETLKSEMGPNWRRNLKRSERTPVIVRRLSIEDLPAISQLEKTTTALKGINVRSSQASGDILGSLGDCAVVVGVFSTSSEMVSLRGASILGTSARDLVSATSMTGRRTYASYAATWELIRILKSLGIRHFDLAGIDPVSNPGVADFKCGLGGNVIDYAGEYVSSRPQSLKFLANLVLYRQLSSA